MTALELQQYYQALLIVQYALKTKARGTVGAVIAEAVASMIISQVREGFSLASGVGVQLDIMGQYRGAQRNVYGLDNTKDYFALMPAGGVPADYKGFSMAADFPMTSWYWLTAADFTADHLVLNDAQMRQLIQYLAAVQSAFYSLEAIDDILEQFFGAYLTVEDNEDMTVTYTHDSTDPNLLFTVVNFLDALPKPAGVAVSVVEV